MRHIKRFFKAIGLWLVKVTGEPDELIAARKVVADVEKRFGDWPGPLKAREAARALANHLPLTQPRALNFLIEQALQ